MSFGIKQHKLYLCEQKRYFMLVNDCLRLIKWCNVKLYVVLFLYMCSLWYKHLIDELSYILKIPGIFSDSPSSIRNSWERNIQGFPHVFIPKLQFTTSCISAHIHITVFQLVSLQSVYSPLLNTITTYLVSFTFICQRAECTTCLPVKSTILSTASQPWYGYSSSKVRWSKGYCIHNTLRCGCCW